MYRFGCCLLFLAIVAVAFQSRCHLVSRLRHPQRVMCKERDENSGGDNKEQTGFSSMTTPLSERATLKAQEVFITRNTGKFECQACGYIYDEELGVPQKSIPPGVAFESLEKFRCPQCGANKKYFVAEQETLSGFKENQKFGLGANSLTGDQKGALIFGGLFLGFLIFMSGYLLE